MKNLKTIATLFLICSFVIAGCGKKDQSQQNTTGDNKQLNQDVKTDNTQKTEVQKTDDSKKDGKNDLGIKEGIPADYPKDIPQPKNAKVLGSLNTSEGTTVTFESQDKPLDLLKDFAENVEKGGFKKAEGEPMQELGGMTLWKKDAREVSLMIAWDKEKNKSSLVVTYK